MDIDANVAIDIVGCVTAILIIKIVCSMIVTIYSKDKMRKIWNNFTGNGVSNGAA